MSSLKNKFYQEIIPAIMSKSGFKNIHAVPRLNKIVLNMGVKEALADKKKLEEAKVALSLIAGQRARVTFAKKAIASFKLRQGDAIGLMITLRGKRMYDFLEKLINIVLPRIRNFHGVSLNSFDQKGNYTLGFRENTAFPEIDAGKIDEIRGLEVTIVTTAKNEQEGRLLLEALGMPFIKS